MFLIVVSMDNDVILIAPFLYSKVAGCLVLKTCCPLGELNLMKFLFISHERPPWNNRSNCANRAADAKIYGAIIS